MALLTLGACAVGSSGSDGEPLGCAQFTAAVLEQPNNMVFNLATDTLEIDTATTDYVLVGSDPACVANPDAVEVLKRERAAAPR